MPKTVIEKVSSPHSGVKVLKIGGTLGFHEKGTLTKLLDECEKRGIAKLVIDLSDLTSLGGGCAGILRDAANTGAISIGVSGASQTTLQFLQKKGESCRIHFASSIAEAISTVECNPAPDEPPPAEPDPQTLQDASAGVVAKPAASQRSAGESSPAASDPPAAATDNLNPRTVICLGYDVDHVTAGPESPKESQPAQADDPTILADSMDADQSDAPHKAVTSRRGRLAKKLFHYDAMLSISSEYNRMPDIARLLDTFLLTTMAQVGVEHTAFLELRDGEMVPLAARGIELDQVTLLHMIEEEWSEFAWDKTDKIVELANCSLPEDLRDHASSLGFIWAVPFMVYGELRGMVLLGRPIKSSLDEDSFDVMKILLHHASVAFENIRRFEEESYRTLGLIQTLISLIEENTLARGSTSFIANYSYILAKKMHHPEEQLRDFVFGVVLRDIGMIKVSDLIVRNPRELDNEAWEIIKQHPLDGADMLKKMRFSDLAVAIVLYHHERFNGEGYPNKLRGTEIPLGARIVSVVESFSAMLQNRPTRPALTREEAMNAVKENWGMRYDPEVVRKFVEIIEEETRTGERVKYTDNELFKNRGDLLCRRVFS
ncbi:MAG: HD domain-containing phosphohydrolase [Candidatus Latescibacterota bacterium]